MLCVVCCSLGVACCLLLAACCLLFVVCCRLFVVRYLSWFVGGVVCCLSRCGVRRVLCEFVCVRCLSLFVGVCYLLVMVRCLLFVVC